MEPIEFIASLPPITSAINIAGDSGNSRIKLDIPASEVAQVARLLLLLGKSFKVTLEPIDDGTLGGSTGPKAAGRKSY